MALVVLDQWTARLQETLVAYHQCHPEMRTESLIAPLANLLRKASAWYLEIGFETSDASGVSRRSVDPGNQPP